MALRPAWLAAVRFDADVVPAAVAAGHVSFRQRVFGYETLSEPRDYPSARFEIVCLALDFPSTRDAVVERYPILRSTEAEREALFGAGRAPYALGSEMARLEAIAAWRGAFAARPVKNA